MAHGLRIPAAMKIHRTNLLATILLALTGLLVVSGCNTMGGLGKDVEKAGEKLQDAADR